MSPGAHALKCAQPPATLLFHGWDADTCKSRTVPVMKCDGCALVFSDWTGIDEVPDHELYAEGYYGEKVSERFLNRFMIGIFQMERQRLTVRGKPSGRVLDIGCGDGTYLRHLPPEWDRRGFEPSRPGQQALEAHGIAFHDLSVPSDERFDLVTMWQTLEHIEDPRALLETISERLTPEGRLFVSVPNFGSLQARLFGRNWFHLDPTRHRYHFTRKTLERLLEEQAFEVEKTTTVSFEYGVYGWWQSLLNLTPVEFNMVYKLLKARKQFDKDFRFYCALGLQGLLAGPFLVVALFMTIGETLFGKGGVIQCTARSRTRTDAGRTKARDRLSEKSR